MLVALLVAANIFNIAADISAMGSALSLVIGGLDHEHALIFAAASVLLQVFVPYRRYAPFLKFLTLALFAYVATAFSVRIPWGTALLAAVWPTPTFSSDYFMMIVAVLGTTISPYLFYWQAAQEVEEMNQAQAPPAVEGAAARRRRGDRPHHGRHRRRHGHLQPDRILHRDHHGRRAERQQRHRTSSRRSRPPRRSARSPAT